MDDRDIRAEESRADTGQVDADADLRAQEWIRRRLGTSRRDLLLAWAPWKAGNTTRTLGKEIAADAKTLVGQGVSTSRTSKAIADPQGTLPAPAPAS